MNSDEDYKLTAEDLTEVMIKQFLLGQLSESNRQRVEEIFVCNDDVRERILINEDELIEDYLEGNLTSQDRHSFLGFYLSSPQQHRKLQIAKTLKQTSAQLAAPEGESDDESKSRVQSLLKFFGLRHPRTLVPVTVALIIIVAIGTIWTVQRQRTQSAEAQRRAAIQQQLDEANSPAAIGATESAQVFSTALPPISVRAGTRPIQLPTNAKVLELSLQDAVEDRFRTYRAQLSRVGSIDKFSVSSLRADHDSRHAIRLRIPTSLLTPGDYEIALVGIDSSGKEESIRDYAFSYSR